MFFPILSMSMDSHYIPTSPMGPMAPMATASSKCSTWGRPLWDASPPPAMCTPMADFVVRQVELLKRSSVGASEHQLVDL